MTSSTNWPAPARLSVGVVSGGRVGSAVGHALESAGHVVGGVVASSSTSAALVARRLPDSQIGDLTTVAAVAELLVIAVPDSVLETVIDELAAVIRPGTIVAHTAGAYGVGILDPLTQRGATPLAIHPAMTFTGSDEDLTRLRTACFGITALDDIGYAIAQALVLEIGGEPVRIREEARTLYHAALAHGANHLVALVSDAVAALRIVLAGQELPGQDPITDAPDGLPERILEPLLTAALDNTLRSGPAALTGPVARGDAAAVAAHLEALEEADPQLAVAYRAMSRRAAAYTDAPAPLLDVLAGPR